MDPANYTPLAADPPPGTKPDAGCLHHAPDPAPPPFHKADVVAVLRVDHGLLFDRLLFTLVVLLLLQRSSSFLADGNSNDVIFSFDRLSRSPTRPPAVQGLNHVFCT
ncbi:uncharacterized protein LOC119280933 [Triticum dicoccoides]|uniref:uncharacterized protein LOC119280933 n=1 Tax=Triticum dicoccoides TaxID=85692 RepID=UPI00188F3B73|nr:uncharacterized protein LOC119280933 [Triticum dicoccoides]